MMVRYLLILNCFLSLLLSSVSAFSQDTIYVASEPRVILKSWYPEFKDFPKLEIGKSKILFTKIPQFEKLMIRDNKIDLKTIYSNVEIKETEKQNQFLVTVKNHAKANKSLIFEVWFDVGMSVVLINKTGDWVNIKELYPLIDGKVLIDKINLKVEL